MKRAYLGLWLVSLILFTLAAGGIDSPGYMDADYYFATARQLADGKGLSQPFLWHYLDNPQGLPHASHGYWMPVTTLVAALPLWLFRSNAFQTAQIPFVLLSSFLPVMTAYFAYRFHQQRRWAVFSGLLALFSGFYFLFFLTTDNFILFVWIGGLILWLLAWLNSSSSRWKWLILGMGIGLAHLTRTDGILLILPAVWAAVQIPKGRWLTLFIVAVGFLLVESPWWIRNLDVFGSLLPPSNSRVVWLTSYNDLFAYPASKLNWQHWLSAGLNSNILVRLKALWLNIQHIVAEPGMIFWWPFAIVALRQHRQHPWVRYSLLYLALMFTTMTVVFPFAGMRGGVFHSSTAVLPLVWVMAPIGLDKTIGWAAERRKWEMPQASRVFSTAAMVLTVLITCGLYFSRTTNLTGHGSQWDASQRLYHEVGEILDGLQQVRIRVAVNNPPGFWLATGREAVVIPDGDENTLFQVIQAFEVDAVVLDRNVPSGLEELYRDPDQIGWLRIITSLTGPDQEVVWILEVLRP